MGTDGEGDGTARDVHAVTRAEATERLRAQIARLRRSARRQSVTEQATGVLAGLIGCSVDHAHGHLLRLAHDSGVPPETAAALLLGEVAGSIEDAAGESAERDGAGGPRTGTGARPRWATDPSASSRWPARAPQAPYAAPDEIAARPAGEPAAEAPAIPADPPEAPAGPPDTPADRLPVTMTALGSARTADELARVLGEELLGRLAPKAVLFAAIEPDGALLLAGSYGLPAHVVSAWNRIPPHPGVALVHTATTGRPLWAPRPAEHAFVGAAAGLTGERACLPLRAAGRVFAATEIVWPEGTVLSAEARRHVAAVVTSCGHRLQELVLSGETPGRVRAEAPWLRTVLDAIPDPAALISPVRDADGRIVDFVIDACNAEATDPTARRPEEMVGLRVFQTWRLAVEFGLFEAYLQTLETGLPLHRSLSSSADAPGEYQPPTMTVRGYRVGQGLLVTWRFHSDSESLDTQLWQAQRLGNLGWSVWELAQDRTSWSPQLYTIFGQDPADGPLTAEQIAGRVPPEDLPVAESVLRTLLQRREPVDTEFGIQRGDEVRRLRVMAEPVLDPLGEPVALRSVYQDITRRHRDAQALAATREQAEHQRHIAVELQRAILPTPERFVAKHGLRAAVRYLPASTASRVGGDWYETTAMDDGEVFLAIGDVSGHGLPAAAAMARLRNALSGLAFTGADPGQLLGWLNHVVLHWPVELTATVLAARYEPENRTLTWAQAGHLPPLLVRGGDTAFLEPPEGLMLGACGDARFATATADLERGDLLVLCTDGLIERRDCALSEGLELLRKAAADCQATGGRATGPDRCVEHVLQELGAPNPNDDTCLMAVQIQ